MNKKYEIPWQNLDTVYSYNTARYLGLDEQGMIGKGFDASLTILELKPFKIRTDEVYTKCKWSPFTGRTFPGYCSDLIHKGEFLKKDGKVLI